jgi:hypothetical protein
MADEPTVNVPLSTYDKLRDDLRTTQAKNYELEKSLAAAQLSGGDTTGVPQLLHDAFHDAIKIVQFAVGNLDPATVVGWPHAAVMKIADAIEKIPGVDRHVSEMPIELREFAKNAAGFEAFRKERDKNKVVVAASAEDFGPKTAEAAAVHAAYAAKQVAQDDKTAAPDETNPPSAA